MRKSLHIARAAGHQPKAGVVYLALALAIPLLATGCGKKNDASTPNVAPTASNSNAEASGTSAPAVNLQPLNQALLQWRVQNRRVPANFEEFAASADIKIPPPPAGKKYVINSSGLISLVNSN